MSEFKPCSLVRLYNAGYQAGHRDKGEGEYTDIFEVDMETYHENVVVEILEETGETRPAPKLPEGYREIQAEWAKKILQRLREDGDLADPNK